ncbi:ArsA family ATPase [Sinobaca sp. H24]|uniref:ArsA family ATPase n=1 Tax=Sinobaca sp. H24 TaxID=2923376 RepID=UPI00207938BD|nr:ArsA family ATPase [Sinobaca sp. H24]
MKTLFKKEILFFGGKGGVGKSTSASAFALASAEAGYRTLLVSTDPAHNLSDLFDQTIGDEKTALADNLWGMEIDPQQEARRYIERVKQNLKGVVRSSMADEVNRQIDMAAVSPGSDESALFDRLIHIILEEKEAVDTIVFDTAPTGHTVRLLSLPEMMEAWMEGMLKRRSKVNDNYSQWMNDGEPVEDPIYQILMERKDRFSRVRRILMDPKRTACVYVLVPEKLPIAETKRALQLLEQVNMPVPAILINKCMPESAGSSPFIQKRRAQEADYIKQIKEAFPGQQQTYLPLLEEDIHSIADIRTIAEAIVPD